MLCAILTGNESTGLKNETHVAKIKNLSSLEQQAKCFVIVEMQT